MEAKKRPLKRLPQVTHWELQRHTVTIRNPLAWDKTGPDKPIVRDIVDLRELCLHRAGEGVKPLFNRDDILVNQDGMEERTMKVTRSRSSSSSSSSASSGSVSIPGLRGKFPKPLRFTCEKKAAAAARSSPEAQKDQNKAIGADHSNKRKRDRRSRSPYRKQSVSPYRKQRRANASRSPDRPAKGRAESSAASRRSPAKYSTGHRLARSPGRGGRSPDKSHFRLERSPMPGRSSPRPGRSRRSPERSREGRRRSRSPTLGGRRSRSPTLGGRRSRSPISGGRTKRNSPRRSRSPHRYGGNRYREFDKGRRSPPMRRREYSPRREEGETSMYQAQSAGQMPPIDYNHLAHVITQILPRQPFMPPHILPQPPSDFYPHYGIPANTLPPPRPRFPQRPPIVYNNRTIKIFRPTESLTGSTNVTTTAAPTSTVVSPTTSTSVISSARDDGQHDTCRLGSGNVEHDTSAARSNVTSTGDTSHN